jgi:hypothetical protein
MSKLGVKNNGIYKIKEVENYKKPVGNKLTSAQIIIFVIGSIGTWVFHYAMQNYNKTISYLQLGMSFDIYIWITLLLWATSIYICLYYILTLANNLGLLTKLFR